MKRSKQLIGGLLVLWACVSCQQEEESLADWVEELPYFDLKGLVEALPEQLQDKRVDKISRLGEEEASSESRLSMAEWKEELAIFETADINKKSLLLAYDTEEYENLLVHRKKSDVRAKVQELKVEYAEGETLKSVRFASKEEGLFYNAITSGVLTFDAGALETYTIESHQKTWFLPKNYLKVEGSIKK